jgi:hypothetical protein
MVDLGTWLTFLMELPLSLLLLSLVDLVQLSLLVGIELKQQVLELLAEVDLGVGHEVGVRVVAVLLHGVLWLLSLLVPLLFEVHHLL